MTRDDSRFTFFMFSFLNNNKNLNKQIKLYKKLYERYGESHLSLSWLSSESQKIRFKTFLDLVKPDQSFSLLDLGCGLGDFYEYLIRCQYQVHYVGIDIVDDFIEKNKLKFPQASWSVNDAGSYLKTSPKYDYIFASGLFAFSNEKIFLDTVGLVMNKVNLCFGFNIHLTSDKSFFSPSVQRVKNILNNIENLNIEIRDDYLKNDYTIILNKKI